MMRTLSLLVLLCVAALVTLAFQSIRQELSIQTRREHMLYAANQVRRLEDAIVQAKLKIQEINSVLGPVNAKKVELAKKKKEMITGAALVLTKIEECVAVKPEVEVNMHTAHENLEKFKAKRAEEKAEAEEKIQELKKRILDRDSQLCEFVDMKQEEGRKLCAAAAPK
ncbi:uncharacterized protein si:dkey-87o1.2 [Conger conger]|uniref:uncharacterized protein si:dkey-87o1.2 n=1 Tax=Conger conger TaxID=82655 RepID=UPI002A5A1AD3|nr:uncharacterized protein si:dkey-87o1.2 [Conger conger]